MDLDGDGYLSMYELEYFYEEQLHRMEMIIETLPFEDCLCQVISLPFFLECRARGIGVRNEPSIQTTSINMNSLADAGHDKPRNSWKNISERFEKVQDDVHFLRYLLQLGKISGPRAAGSVRIHQRSRCGRTRGTLLAVLKIFYRDIKSFKDQ